MANVNVPTGLPYHSLNFRRVRNDSIIGKMGGASVNMIGRADVFVASVNLKPMRGEQARAWRSFILQVASLENTFVLPAPDYTGPSSGYAGPVPKVKGGSQTGKTLECDNVTPGATILKNGDWLRAGSQLEMVVADAVANGSGVVNFSLLRSLREAPSDNSTVEIAAPTGVFKLVESVGEITLDKMATQGLAFTAVEDF